MADPHEQSLVFRLISILEDYGVENLKLKTFIRSLPMAEQPGFSLDDLLNKTELCADSERDLRARYDAARVHLQRACDYQSALKQVLLDIEAAKRMM
jgi:hypothetical protein